ncbi:MAG: hypothetical protein ABIK89_15610, partial [Planctomycetota bacterium]
MMLVARRNKLLTAVVLSLAVCVAAATASVSAQDAQVTAQVYPHAWEPNFEPVAGSRSTLVLTNEPSETGMIIPFDRVGWATNVGPLGNEPYTTYLKGTPGRNQMYLQWRIWPPNNTTMSSAHWHPVLRTEAFVFGDGYWHGSGRVVDHKYRTHQFAGDFLVEEAGGHHFGWTDPDAPDNTVFFIFGTEAVIDHALEEVPGLKHNTFWPGAKIPWEPGQGTGPMFFNMVGDPTKADPGSAGWYNQINKWSPGNAIKARKYSGDRYGMVISGRLYIGWGEKTDPKKAQLLTKGTFFSQPAGMSVYMYVPANEPEDAVVVMYG